MCLWLGGYEFTRLRLAVHRILLLAFAPCGWHLVLLRGCDPQFAGEPLVSLFLLRMLCVAGAAQQTQPSLIYGGWDLTPCASVLTVHRTCLCSSETLWLGLALLVHACGVDVIVTLAALHACSADLLSALAARVSR